jgi:hypothetical protein
MYELRTVCCSKPAEESLFQNVEVEGTGWRAINFTFDDLSGIFDHEVDSHTEEIQWHDENLSDIECVYCGKAFFDIEQAVEVINVGEDGEISPLGRYWCDYCGWQGNFVEDHDKACTFKISGPQERN